MKSIPTFTEQDRRRFWRWVHRRGAGECWEWGGSYMGNGYGQFSVAGVPIYAHRAVLLLAGVTLPDGSEVCHRCDNPPCVNPAHLFVGTRSDNQRDSVRKGRARGQLTSAATRGVRNTKAKLTPGDVREIRRRAAEGEKQTDLAREFGVTQPAVGYIARRETWKHVA